MAVATLLGNLPWAWRIALGAAGILLLGGVFGAGVIKGFATGHGAATAKGEAAIAALQRDHARQQAEMLARHLDRVRREAERAMQASAALAQAKEEHATTQELLRARIAGVTRNSVHRFSPDFVRLFNEAVGAAAVSGNGMSGTAGTSAEAGTRAGFDSGVRQSSGSGKNNRKLSGEGKGTGQPARVSERDVLAYIIYYGKRCRDMEAQLGALIRIMGERNERY